MLSFEQWYFIHFLMDFPHLQSDLILLPSVLVPALRANSSDDSRVSLCVPSALGFSSYPDSSTISSCPSTICEM